MIEPSLEDYSHANLLSYCRYHWPQFEISKYHILIAKCMQQIEKGEITRLIISLPPRSGKTMLVTYFIAWFLGRNPTSEVIYTSYNSGRANDVGRACRNIMLSEAHTKVFPDGTLALDAKASGKFATKQNGSCFCVGWGSSVTGRGANLFVTDDMIKDRVDDKSELSSLQRKEWFSSTAYTRLMPKDLKRGKISAIIAIGTRWSYDDFLSYLKRDLAHEHWLDLSFPAICEDVDVNAESGKDILGRVPGEALWPEKFDLDTLEKTKRTLTPLDWSALYQQRPLPTSGGMIHLDWFKRFELSKIIQLRDLIKSGADVPDNLKYVETLTISIDSASKTNQVNDMTSITVWASDKKGTNHYMIDCINRKVEFPDLVRLVENTFNTYRHWGFGTPRVLCEDRSSGIALIQHLKRFTQIPILPVNPCKSKELRMEEAIVNIEAGRIWLPSSASWLYDVELQISQFPLGQYRDICDSISQFINYKFKRKLRKSRYNRYIR